MSVATYTESRVHNRTLEFTRDFVLRQIYDTVFDNSPLLAAMLGRLQNSQFGPVMLNGRGKETQRGGESIYVRHNLGTNSTAQTLAGPWAEVDTTPSDTVRGSRANWKHYSATVTVSESDLLINTGEEALSSLVQFETENAVRSLGDLAADDIYNGSAADEITGIDTLIGAGTLQGLNPTTYTTWTSRGLSARGTAPGSVSFTSGSFTAQGLSDMRTLYNNASEGAMQPHALYTGWSEYGYYEGALQPQERFTNSNVADAGFQQLLFKSAPIFPDAKATSGAMYAVNFDRFGMRVLAGADLSAGPFERAEVQEARVSKVMLKCNQIAKDRRFINKMTGITA